MDFQDTNDRNGVFPFDSISLPRKNIYKSLAENTAVIFQFCFIENNVIKRRKTYKFYLYEEM
jgi:hypothetical protein